MFATRRTYLILRELEIILDGFGNQRREGEPRQTVCSISDMILGAHRRLVTHKATMKPSQER